MSAGGLSYSGLTNYGRVTLPSVEGWGTNMNILRDPPKSITTRRIDKVGETSSITQMIDDSGNRAAEAIKVFARGVNPCVGVSYNNYGNNGGGGQSGHLTGLSQPIGGTGRQAKLPYNIMRDGAFRPPVLTQEDLLPLSRLPRVWTSAYSQPGFADFSKKARTCVSAERTREVKSQTLKASIKPTARYIVQTPIEEPFEVRYVIQPTLKKSVTSGVRSMDVTQREVKKPTKEIYISPLHADAHTKQIEPGRYVNNSVFNTEPYIQDASSHQVGTNTSSNKHHTNIDEILDLSDLPVREIRTTSHVAPKNHSERENYIHDPLELHRNLPKYQMIANKADSTKYKRNQYTNSIELSRNIPNGSFSSNIVARGGVDHGSRTARLIPKITVKGYHNSGQRPMLNRMQNAETYRETEKARTSRIVMESMQGRFSKPAPWA
jgi:hypothetical protein